MSISDRRLECGEQKVGIIVLTRFWWKSRAPAGLLVCIPAGVFIVCLGVFAGVFGWSSGVFGGVFGVFAPWGLSKSLVFPHLGA